MRVQFLQDDPNVAPNLHLSDWLQNRQTLPIVKIERVVNGWVIYHN